MRLGITFFISGIMLVIFGLAMLVPGLLDLADGNISAETFWISSLITCFFGALFMLCFYDKWDKLSGREMYLTTSFVWILVSGFCALPFYLAPAPSTYTDAYFEAMSGLTTTGATVFSNLSSLSRGILLWRALLQWVGGLGIIVIAIAILPILRIGGMQLFSTESSDKSGKNMPKTSQIIGTMMMVYVSETILCILCLYWADLSLYDAVSYSLTTVPTGGFAPYDSSAGHLSDLAQWIITFFMFVAGLPLFFIYFFFKADLSHIKNNMQVRTYCLFYASVVAVLTLWWVNASSDQSFFDALRLVAFNVISVITTTGFATEDYATWGPFATMVFFFLLPIGACSGSTAGGIKIFRFNILYLFSVRFLRNKIMPHGVFVAKFDGKPVSEDVISSVLVFMTIYFVCLVVSSLLLSLLGLDLVTAITGTTTALGNVGPGLGATINPAGNFMSLPAGSKWIFSFDMLVGRLEYMTVFVLLLPLAWRREKKTAVTSSF